MLAGALTCGGHDGTTTRAQVEVSPSAPSLGVGLSRQLSVSARAGGFRTSQRLEIVWQSTDPGVATVRAGVVYGVAPGSAGIVATTWGGSDTARVTVTLGQSPLVGISISPSSLVLGVGGALRFSATGLFADSSSGSVTEGAAWHSSAPGVARVRDGLVTGVGPGDAVIVAQFGGHADSSRVTVEPRVTASGVAYPLKSEPGSRHLVDQHGRPFLLVGDAAWSLIAQLAGEDVEAYLSNRQLLGFNAVLVSLIEHKYAAHAPANAGGIGPFNGPPFTSPNEAYFAFADSIIRSAARKGILVLLAPLYLGNECGDQGWCAEVQAATPADLIAWGRFVGDRYRNDANIIWVIGGDTDPSPVRSEVLAFVNGVRSVDTAHLFTAHNGPEEMAVQPWSGESWLGVNNVYTYRRPHYQAGLAAYGLQPVLPYFLMESAYEGDSGVTARQLRAQSYWTILSGGMGHVFGNCPLWHFGAAELGRWCSRGDWKEELNSAGSRDMRTFARLFSSRHWWLLVPDTAHRVLTTGQGRFGDADFATAAYASDSSSIIVYLPTSRTVTVSGSVLSGSTMVAWWFDPATGRSTRIGTYATAGGQSFTPPSEGDWVLVVDSERFDLRRP
jgi:Protein of unknown function (DUF4038)/Putative collagen-binding domain of a collagenase/Bacterial Ig-like domain (group 2)